MASTATRAHVHELIDQVSDDEIEALHAFLHRLLSAEPPIERALLRASLLEPEELSPEDEAAIEEALAETDEVPHSEALRLLFDKA